MALEIRVDGRKVFAATGGRTFDPASPTVVFIHGASMNRTVWSAQARYFAHHGRGVLAPDLPGHGNSEGGLLATVEDVAGWIVRFMDAAGVDRAALVGHSMGSLPVLEAAARHPDRIERIALLGASAPMPVSAALLGAAKADDHAAYDMVTLWGHGKRAQIGGNDAPGLWVTVGGLRLLERGGDGVLHNDMKACDDYAAGLEAAAGVRCPATLILGENDAMTPPRNAKALAESLPGARTIEIEGCGHMMMSEKPNETLDALIEALG